jgi:hypothetical protein
LYVALTYGTIYLMLATYRRHGPRSTMSLLVSGGLNYISLLIGLIARAQASGRLIDLIYRRLKSRAANEEGRPEFRVPVLSLSTSLISCGLFMFGWSVQAHTHWIVPNIGAAIFGADASMTFTAVQTYTIDSYQLFAASALEATAVARSTTAFAFPLFGDYVFDAIGAGWGNSVLAFVAMG